MNDYNEAIQQVEAVPYANRDERERLWEELSRPLRQAHVPQLYAYCPVCENTLDWAWCVVCGKYR